MESLDNMLNIGKEMKRKLFSIGVRSSEDLIRLGSKRTVSKRMLSSSICTARCN